MTRTLFIGNKNLSSWSLRPWLVLRHAGLPFEERMLRFEEPGWRTSIREISPMGTVPVLHDGDLVIGDSLAICEYLAEERPELWPADRVLRAQARAVAAEMHSGFASLRRELPMDVTARVPRAVRSEETQRAVERVLAIWNARRADLGPFLFGAFSIADAMFAPVVFRFRTYDVPLSGAAAEYAARMLALPAMQEWAAAAALETRPGAATEPPDPTSAEHSWAVIFTSRLGTGARVAGYGAMATTMEELAAKQPGYLGMESARGEDGLGITVSYWGSLAAISSWKSVAAHRVAQERGRSSFYDRYEVRICSVERSYRFSKQS